MRAFGVLVIAVCLTLTAAAAPAAYREEAVSNGGTISGRVLVAGTVPKLPPQPVYKQHEVCGQTMPDERLEVGPGGALRYAVIQVDGVSAGKPIPRDQPVPLDNRKCAFVPHVLDATVGQTLQIHNDDPFLHDAHAWLGTRTLFNVGVLPGHTVSRPLNDAGLVHINCNVRHTWMHAFLFVGENPYHAITDAEGRFRIDQVPPGSYTLTVWHELLGTVERPVKVESGQTTTVDFALPMTATDIPPAVAP
jgi:plastocyanin